MIKSHAPKMKVGEEREGGGYDDDDEVRLCLRCWDATRWKCRLCLRCWGLLLQHLQVYCWRNLSPKVVFYSTYAFVESHSKMWWQGSQGRELGRWGLCVDATRGVICWRVFCLVSKMYMSFRKLLMMDIGGDGMELQNNYAWQSWSMMIWSWVLGVEQWWHSHWCARWMMMIVLVDVAWIWVSSFLVSWSVWHRNLPKYDARTHLYFINVHANMYIATCNVLSNHLRKLGQSSTKLLYVNLI